MGSEMCIRDRLSVLKAAVGADYVWLAVLAVIMSVIGAFYYLRAIKMMFFDEPVDTTPVSVAPDVNAALAVNGLAVLVLGIFPGLFMTACIRAFSG